MSGTYGLLQAVEEEKELVSKFSSYRAYQEDGPPMLVPSITQIIGRQ